jgi:hypothetical protein
MNPILISVADADITEIFNAENYWLYHWLLSL